MRVVPVRLYTYDERMRVVTRRTVAYRAEYDDGSRGPFRRGYGAARYDLRNRQGGDDPAPPPSPGPPPVKGDA